MIGKFACRILVISAFALIGVVSSYAQTPAYEPNIEQRRLEEQRRLDAQQKAQQEQLQPKVDIRQRIEEPKQTARLMANEIPCFNINKIGFDIKDSVNPETGKAYSSPNFGWSLAAMDTDADGKPDSPFTTPDTRTFKTESIGQGKCIGAQSVNTILTRIQNAIIARGYATTRVLAAPQDLKAGVLSLTLIPGRVRAIKFVHETDSESKNAGTNAAPITRIPTSWKSALPIREGDILNIRNIEQALENLKRIQTADADIQITPAEDSNEPGQSDLVIKYKQGKALRVNASFDDSGTTSTGKYQGSLTVSWDNPLGFNDILTFTLNHDIGGYLSQHNSGKDPLDRGTQTYDINYSVPYGDWLYTLNTSKNHYHQTVAGAYQNYLYTGDSENQDLTISYLLFRDATRKTYAKLKLWAKESQNYIDGTVVGVQKRRTAGWDLSLNNKEYIGDANIDATLTWHQGTGALNALAAPEAAFNEGSSRPKIILADISLDAPFKIGNQKFKWNTSYHAQWNRNLLIPSDDFTLGGRYTIRGYDGKMILQTERGFLLRNELSAELENSKQQLYLAYDYGHVGGPSAQYMVTTRLQSIALGLKGDASGVLGDTFKNLTYNMFLGVPIHKDPVFRSAAKAYGVNVNWAM